MRYRLSCPACGKAIELGAQDAGKSVLCAACGTHVAIPPGFGAPGELTPLPQSEPQHPELWPTASAAPEALAEADEAPVAGAASVPSFAPTVIRGKRPRGKSRWLLPVVAAVAVAAAISAGLFIGKKTVAPNASAPQTETTGQKSRQAANADLMRLKAEAEALTLAGRLREAHEKYRQLVQLGIGRELRGADWDLVERAKAEQDRVYWLLMKEMDGADRAFVNGAPGLPLNPAPSSRTQPSNLTPVAPAPPPAPSGTAFWQNSPTRSASQALAPAAPTTRDAQPATVADEATSRPAAGTSPAPPASRPSLVEGKLFAPVPRPPNADDPNALDADVDKAIRRGCDFLLTQFKNNELPREDALHRIHSYGLHALCVYALAAGGQSINDPRLRPAGQPLAPMLDKLRTFDLTSPKDRQAYQPVVYARSLRASALSVYNRPADRKTLKADVDWLVGAHMRGAYGYDDSLRIEGGLNGPRGAANEPAPAAVAGIPLVDRLGRPVMLADGLPVDPRTGSEISHDLRHDKWFSTLTPKMRALWMYYTASADLRRLTDIAMQRHPFQVWDNSNSHMGLLGVWAGANAGVEVPSIYWKDVRKHWIDCALPGGQWPYHDSNLFGTPAMNCAGIAALFITDDYTDLARTTSELAVALPPQQQIDGMQWLEAADNSVSFPARGTRYIGYDLFSVERVGAVTGFRHFGTHDWYRELTRRLLAAQRADGSWGSPNSRTPADAVIDSAFVILFLAHGREPLLMNKLRFDGNWANRPRDAAGAAQFVSHVLERPLGWQVVSINRDDSEWLNAPILYIASDRPPKFNNVERNKLRNYAEAGGLLLVHPDNGSNAVAKWAQELGRDFWPQYPLQDVPDDHPLYNLTFKMPAGPRRPKLQMVHNGSRVLMVVALQDLAGAWRSRDEMGRKEQFQCIANLYAYATGGTTPHSRLVTTAVELPPGKPVVTLKVARLQFAGNWDPEPGAWKRFDRVLQWQTGAHSEVTSLRPAELAAVTSQPVVAHLTGTGEAKLSDADIAALKTYVESGGVLFIDPAGGDAAFMQSIDKAVLPAFTGLQLQELKPGQPPLAKASGVMDDLLKVEVRQSVAAELRPDGGYLRAGQYGQGWVIVSRLDITSGLLGTNTWGIAGFTPEYAKGLMKNVVLWAATRAR